MRVVQETEPDATARSLAAASVWIERGRQPLLELTFDEGAQDKVLDARPALPFIIRY